MAWTAVALFHAVVLVVLLQLPAPLPDRAAGDSTLDVVWVAAPRPSPRPVTARVALVAPPKPRATVEPRRVDARPVPAEAAEDAVATGKPLSAVFLEQARLPEPERLPAPDPFADRTVRLPGRDARTFRMRSSPTPADVLAAVGRLFGGGGDDPCHSNRDTINALSQAGDSRQLQDALAYEKRHCR